MTDAFESSGITAVAKTRNCPLIDMDVRKYVTINIHDGVAVKSLTAEHKNCGIFVSGCPQVASETLKEYFAFYEDDTESGDF